MAERAQVTSVEAIEAFRSNLIIFLNKARPALEEVSGEVLRTRLWLQNEARRFWEHEVRVRRKKLEEAQGELFSSRISSLEKATAAQQMAVHRAHRAVGEAEDKLALLKKWDRELENHSDPLLKHVEHLHDFLRADMARAVAHLAQIVRSLEAYTGPTPGGGPAAAEAVAADEAQPGKDLARDLSSASDEAEREKP